MKDLLLVLTLQLPKKRRRAVALICKLGLPNTEKLLVYLEYANKLYNIIDTKKEEFVVMIRY